MIPENFQKYIRSKEFKDLLKRYQQALEFDTSEYFDADDLLDIAEYFHIKGKEVELDTILSYTLELHPDNEKAHAFLARTFLNRNDVTGAERVLKSYTTNGLADTIFVKAEILINKGDQQGAVELLQKYYDDVKEGRIDIVSADGADDEDDDYDKSTFLNLFVLDIVPLFCDYQMWDEAEQWLTKVGLNDIGPDGIPYREDASYLETKARILTAYGLLDDAITAWNEYIDKDAYSELAWNQLSQCYYRLGDTTNALNAVNYAEAIAPDSPDAYLAEGTIYYGMGKNEEALKAYARFNELMPNDMQGIYLVGCVHFSMERYDEAYHDFIVAKSMFEGTANTEYPLNFALDIYRQLAYTCAALNNVPEAMSYVDKMRELGYSEVDMLLMKSGVLLEAKQTGEAFELISHALEQSSNDPYTYLRIGCMLVDCSVIQAGYALLKDTITIMEQSGDEVPGGYDRLAYAALALGHYDEFLVALEKSIKILPAETLTIFSTMFPEGMLIGDYVEYAKTHVIVSPMDMNPDDES